MQCTFVQTTPSAVHDDDIAIAVTVSAEVTTASDALEQRKLFSLQKAYRGDVKGTTPVNQAIGTPEEKAASRHD